MENRTQLISHVNARREENKEAFEKMSIEEKVKYLDITCLNDNILLYGIKDVKETETGIYIPEGASGGKSMGFPMEIMGGYLVAADVKWLEKAKEAGWEIDLGDYIVLDEQARFLKLTRKDVPIFTTRAFHIAHVIKAKSHSDYNTWLEMDKENRVEQSKKANNKV